MKRDLLFLAEQLVSLLEEHRLAVVAKQNGIKNAKDSESLGKLFSGYLRRAEEGVLGKVLVETTILYMATRHNASEVLRDAAAVYKVDTEAIALKVKQELAKNERARSFKLAGNLRAANDLGVAIRRLRPRGNFRFAPVSP